MNPLISPAPLSEASECEEIFPHALPIAHDGFGNYWIVDLTSPSTAWSPIFYACHDPLVVIFQTDSLGHFISEIIRFGNEPWQSEINDAHEEYAFRVWRDNPGLLTHADCIGSNDEELQGFAETLDETFWLVDLRNPNIGDGFSWGRYGPGTVNRRFGEKRIFAYQKRPSLCERLIGRWL